MSHTVSEYFKTQLISELDFYDETLYPKLESESHHLVTHHIRKMGDHCSDDEDSQNSQLEIEKEDSLISSVGSQRKGGDINSLEESLLEKEEDSIIKEGLQISYSPQLEVIHEW